MAIYGSIFLYPENVAIDATQPLTLSCVVDGTLITQYQWRIWNIANNSLVWDSGLVTLPTPLTNRSNLFVTVPLNTMVNGNEYKHSVTTSDGVNSVTSIEVGFITNTNPTITFTIPSTITAPAYKFTPIYTQAQNVGIEYSYFKFYNNIGELILTTDKNYSGDLSYTFSGFDNNLYGIQFLGETYNKVSFQTGIINFGVSYGSPSVNMKLNTSQDKCNGNVTVSWGNMTIVEGYSNGTFQYIENAVGGNYGVHLDANSNIYWNLDISDYFTVKKIWKKDNYEWYDSIAQLEFGDVKYKVGYQYGRFYFDNNGNIGWSDLTPLPNDFIFIIIQRNRVVINNNGVLIPVTFDNLGINTQSKLTTDYVNTATISNVYAGKVNEFNVGGATLNQVVTNGDFSNGTTGWSGAGAVLSVNSKILSITNNGTLAYGLSSKSGLVVKQGEKWFIKSRVRVTNSNCQSLSMYIDGSSSSQYPSATNPTQNQWVDLIKVFVASTNYVAINIRHNYADTTTANGKVMEVDGNIGVFAIPITGTPYENYTADQINSMLGGYFEGLKSTRNIEITSIGSNSQESTLSVTCNGDFELSKLPNGVQNEVNQVAGYISAVERVKKSILQSSQITQLYTGFTNVDAVVFSYSAIPNIKDSLTSDLVATKMITSVSTPLNSAPADNVTSVWKHYFNIGNIGIIVPKGTYANLATAQSALAGTVIYYQLATPLTSPYFVTTNGELVLPNTNGNSLTTDATIIPEVGITYYNR